MSHSAAVDRRALRGERFAEQPQPIAMEYVADVACCVSAAGENRIQLLQVCNGLQTRGRLLGTKAAVQV